MYGSFSIYFDCIVSSRPHPLLYCQAHWKTYCSVLSKLMRSESNRLFMVEVFYTFSCAFPWYKSMMLPFFPFVDLSLEIIKIIAIVIITILVSTFYLNLRPVSLCIITWSCTESILFTVVHTQFCRLRLCYWWAVMLLFSCQSRNDCYIEENVSELNPSNPIKDGKSNWLGIE